MRAGLSAEKLHRAGAELADEVGFEQVTLSLLARHFGVAVASLYSHLRSSRELKVGIALLALAELADRTATALAGRAGADALAAFANSCAGTTCRRPSTCTPSGSWAASSG